jgi:hypothetical protein
MRQHHLEHQEPSLGELFGELTRSSRELVRQEIQLARLEMKVAARRMGRGAVLLATGAALSLGALLALLAGVTALLSGIMPVWLAALLVACVAGFLGALLARRGLTALQAASEVPAETVDHVREDVLWLKKRR